MKKEGVQSAESASNHGMSRHTESDRLADRVLPKKGSKENTHAHLVKDGILGPGVKLERVGQVEEVKVLPKRLRGGFKGRAGVGGERGKKEFL